MEPHWKLLHEDLLEVKSHLIDLVKQGAINTQTLVEHERRSTNMEQRLFPLEEQSRVTLYLGKGVLGLGGFLGVIKVILELKKLL